MTEDLRESFVIACITSAIVVGTFAAILFSI